MEETEDEVRIAGELVTIVIPVKNEEKNVAQLLKEIDDASKMHYPKFGYAVIVVDDGDDATATIARSCKARVVEGRHLGLGQAILDGIGAAASDIVVVMDGDLSHSPHALPGLLGPILSGEADMVIGSRYCYVEGIGGGSIEGWTRKRRLISKVACLMARPVTKCKDATSGFFIIRKRAINTGVLEASSWKMMLEILVKCQPRWVELPIVFQDRHKGQSKFNQKETVRYLRHLWKLWRWRGHSVRRPDYDWNSYYKGNPIQKYWKRQVSRKAIAMIGTENPVLEVGCGSSPNLSMLPVKEKIGVDMDAGKVEFMRKADATSQYRVGVGEDMPWIADGYCSAVMCLEVIEHHPHPYKLVKEMARVVKDGGKVVIATPDFSSPLWNLIEVVYGLLMRRGYHTEHGMKFTESAVKALCEGVGLEWVRTDSILGADLVMEFRKVKEVSNR